MADEYLHDPDSVLDYSVDWAVWLRDGETVDDATWAIPDGLVEATQGHAVNGAVATVWIRGGVLGKNYTVTCHVVTSEGREDDHSITLKCRQK